MFGSRIIFVNLKATDSSTVGTCELSTPFLSIEGVVKIFSVMFWLRGRRSHPDRQIMHLPILRQGLDYILSHFLQSQGLRRVVSTDCPTQRRTLSSVLSFDFAQDSTDINQFRTLVFLQETAVIGWFYLYCIDENLEVIQTVLLPIINWSQYGLTYLLHYY